MLSELIEFLISTAVNTVTARRDRNRKHGKPATAPPPLQPHQLAIGKRIAVLSSEGGSAGRGQVELLDQRTRTKHLYAAGSTGSGKSNFLYQLIKADIVDGTTCVVLDARGDYIERLLMLMASLGPPD